MLKAPDKFQYFSLYWKEGRRKSAAQKQVFQNYLLVKGISISYPSQVVVEWKNFDFEMGTSVQQKVSLINYYFMKLILILATNSFLYLILH